MTDPKRSQEAQPQDSGGRAYEPPRVVIIGPLEQITLGSLSAGNDTGPGKKNPKS
jgi:hypothetical protein